MSDETRRGRGRMKRTSHALAVGASLLLWAGLSQAAEPIPAFKDALFGYPAMTAISDDGDSVDVDYSEARDIDERDEVPERRVRSDYVDLKPLAAQRERTVETSAGPLRIMIVGDAASARVVVLFVHGRNGDRRLGMNDRTFGGNFNRLKNLMRLANGLYVTADAGTFSTVDGARIAGLVEALGREHPRAVVILACASMGGEFCWDVAGRAETLAVLDGIVMLSANNDPAKVATMRRRAGARRVPLVLAHGTRDKVFAWDSAKTVYAELRGEGYPVRFVSFDGGNHGTPIRMIDWRDTLNWLLERMG